MPEPPEQKTNESLPLPMSAHPLEISAAGSDERRGDYVSVLMFEIGGKPYAIGVENTDGVVDCPRITPLPSPPNGVVGLVSVRGRMTVAMDLGAGAADDPPKRRLILVKGDAQLGLLADRIDGVLALEPKRVRPVAHGRDSLTKQRAEFGWPATNYFKSGVQRVPIVDVERLVEA